MTRLQALCSIAVLVFFETFSGFNAAEAKPSTVPYQSYKYVHCNPSGPGVDCLLNFPPLTPNHRLELSHVSCYIAGGGSDFGLDFAEIIVMNLQNVPIAAVTLQVTPTGEGNNTKTFSALADVGVYAPANAHFQMDARTLRGFIAMFACNIDGHYLTLS